MTQMTIQQALELAWRQRQAGQLNEAEAITRQVLTAFPGNSDAHSILGVVLHQQGRFDEAITHAKAAIDAFPKAAAYYCRLGAVYLSTDRLNEAIEIYQRGLAIDPNFVDLHNDMGNALKQCRP